MRYNHRHFNAGYMPTWCQRDALLTDRLDGLARDLRAIAEEEDTTPGPAARLIFAAFQ